MRTQLGAACIGMFLSRKGLALVAASGPIHDPGVLACSRITLSANPFAAARVLDPEPARRYLIEVEKDVLERVHRAFGDFTATVTEPGFAVEAVAVPRPSQPARAPLGRVLKTDRLIRGAEERLFLRACRTAVKTAALAWLEYDRSQIFSSAAAEVGLTEREFIALVRSRPTFSAESWTRDLQAACAAALLVDTYASQATTW